MCHREGGRLSSQASMATKPPSGPKKIPSPTTKIPKNRNSVYPYSLQQLWERNTYIKPFKWKYYLDTTSQENEIRSDPTAFLLKLILQAFTKSFSHREACAIMAIFDCCCCGCSIDTSLDINCGFCRHHVCENCAPTGYNLGENE